MKNYKKNHLMQAVSLFLACAMVLTGCQAAAVKEEQASREEQPAQETQQEQAPEEEPAYIDADYIDENYGGGEEEDLSKYRSGGTGAGSAAPGASGGDGSLPGEDNTQGGQNSQNGQNGQSGEGASEENYYTDPIPEGKPEPVEPQDEDVNENRPLTCSLFVECSTILDNMGDLTEGKEDLVPFDGVIYGPYDVTFYDGESVYDLLLREMQDNRIHMESEFTPMYNSAYVQGINNLYEKDCGRWSGWMYNVNGWYPNYGCSRYQIKEGDVIEWRYTCDLGRDLGRDMSEYE